MKYKTPPKMILLICSALLLFILCLWIFLSIKAPPTEEVGTEPLLREVILTGSENDPMLSWALSKLQKESVVRDMLKQTKDGDFTEELPSIEKFFSKNTTNPFYHAFESLRNGTNICSELANPSDQSLCNEIILRKSDAAYLKQIAQEFEFSDFPRTIELIKNHTDCASMKELISYLQCKRVYDESFPVETYMLKYKILIHSPPSAVRSHYRALLKHWGLDKDFIPTIEQALRDTPMYRDYQDRFPWLEHIPE